jgi:hypothetical protein
MEQSTSLAIASWGYRTPHTTVSAHISDAVGALLQRFDRIIRKRPLRAKR